MKTPRMAGETVVQLMPPTRFAREQEATYIPLIKSRRKHERSCRIQRVKMKDSAIDERHTAKADK